MSTENMVAYFEPKMKWKRPMKFLKLLLTR